METLCHGNAANTPLYKTHDQEIDNFIRNDRNEYKYSEMHIYPGFTHKNPPSGILQSIVHTGVNVNQLAPQTMPVHNEYYRKNSKGAILGFKREFIELENDDEIEIMNYVNLTMTPSVFMEYRSKREMERFEDQWRISINKRPDRKSWSRRTVYDKVSEPVVLTCHVQGPLLKEWKLEWLHDAGNHATRYVYTLTTETFLTA